jgi:AP-3 complex subunit delta-1
VPIPENLDLDCWINDPPSENSDSEDMDMNDIFIKTEKIKDSFNISQLLEPSTEELEMRREARKLEQQNNPHYLKNSTISHKKMTFYDKSGNNNDYCENIPITELDIPISLKVTDSILSNKYFNTNRNKKLYRQRHKKINKKNKSHKSN